MPRKDNESEPVALAKDKRGTDEDSAEKSKKSEKSKKTNKTNNIAPNPQVEDLPFEYIEGKEDGRFKYEKVISDKTYYVYDVRERKRCILKVIEKDNLKDCLLGFREYTLGKRLPSSHFVSYLENHTFKDLSPHVLQKLEKFQKPIDFASDKLKDIRRQSESQPYLLMDVADGYTDLDTLRKRRIKLAAKDIHTVIVQTLDAISMLGNMKPALIHRGIREQNILWNPDLKKVKIAGCDNIIEATEPHMDRLSGANWAKNANWLPQEACGCVTHLGHATSVDVYSVAGLVINLLYAKRNETSDKLNQMEPRVVMSQIPSKSLRQIGLTSDLMMSMLNTDAMRRPSPSVILQQLQGRDEIYQDRIKPVLLEIAGPTRKPVALQKIPALSKLIIERSELHEKVIELMLHMSRQDGVSVYRLVCITDCMFRNCATAPKGEAIRKMFGSLATILVQKARGYLDKSNVVKINDMAKFWTLSGWIQIPDDAVTAHPVQPIQPAAIQVKAVKPTKAPSLASTSVKSKKSRSESVKTAVSKESRKKKRARSVVVDTEKRKVARKAIDEIIARPKISDVAESPNFPSPKTPPSPEKESPSAKKPKISSKTKKKAAIVPVPSPTKSSSSHSTESSSSKNAKASSSTHDTNSGSESPLTPKAKDRTPAAPKESVTKDGEESSISISVSSVTVEGRPNVDVKSKPPPIQPQKRPPPPPQKRPPPQPPAPPSREGGPKPVALDPAKCARKAAAPKKVSALKKKPEPSSPSSSSGSDSSSSKPARGKVDPGRNQPAAVSSSSSNDDPFRQHPPKTISSKSSAPNPFGLSPSIPPTFVDSSPFPERPPPPYPPPRPDANMLHNAIHHEDSIVNLIPDGDQHNSIDPDTSMLINPIRPDASAGSRPPPPSRPSHVDADPAQDRNIRTEREKQGQETKHDGKDRGVVDKKQERRKHDRADDSDRRKHERLDEGERRKHDRVDEGERRKRDRVDDSDRKRDRVDSQERRKGGEKESRKQYAGEKDTRHRDNDGHERRHYDRSDEKDGRKEKDTRHRDRADEKEVRKHDRADEKDTRHDRSGEKDTRYDRSGEKDTRYDRSGEKDTRHDRSEQDTRQVDRLGEKDMRDQNGRQQYDRPVEDTTQYAYDRSGGYDLRQDVPRQEYNRSGGFDHRQVDRSGGYDYRQYDRTGGYDQRQYDRPGGYDMRQYNNHPGGYGQQQYGYDAKRNEGPPRNGQYLQPPLPPPPPPPPFGNISTEMQKPAGDIGAEEELGPGCWW